MANLERINAVFNHIKTLPDVRHTTEFDNDPTTPVWDQRKWIAIPPNNMIEGSCGTAGCFAGWAVKMFVPEFTLDLNPDSLLDQRMVYNVIVEGESIPIEHLATDLLDLNYNEADALFDYENDLSDIEAVIEAITNESYPTDDDD